MLATGLEQVLDCQPPTVTIVEVNGWELWGRAAAKEDHGDAQLALIFFPPEPVVTDLWNRPDDTVHLLRKQVVDDGFHLDHFRTMDQVKNQRVAKFAGLPLDADDDPRRTIVLQP